MIILQILHLVHLLRKWTILWNEIKDGHWCWCCHMMKCPNKSPNVNAHVGMLLRMKILIFVGKGRRGAQYSNIAEGESGRAALQSFLCPR